MKQYYLTRKCTVTHKPCLYNPKLNGPAHYIHSLSIQEIPNYAMDEETVARCLKEDKFGQWVKVDDIADIKRLMIAEALKG